MSLHCSPLDMQARLAIHDIKHGTKREDRIFASNGAMAAKSSACNQKSDDLRRLTCHLMSVADAAAAAFPSASLPLIGPPSPSKLNAAAAAAMSSLYPEMRFSWEIKSVDALFCNGMTRVGDLSREAILQVCGLFFVDIPWTLGTLLVLFLHFLRITV